MLHESIREKKNWKRSGTNMRDSCKGVRYRVDNYTTLGTLRQHTEVSYWGSCVAHVDWEAWAVTIDARGEPTKTTVAVINQTLLAVFGDGHGRVRVEGKVKRGQCETARLRLTGPDIGVQRWEGEKVSVRLVGGAFKLTPSTRETFARKTTKEREAREERARVLAQAARRAQRKHERAAKKLIEKKMAIAPFGGLGRRHVSQQ